MSGEAEAALKASPPKAFESKVLGVREECAGVRTLALSVPGDFSFLPGMWVMLNFPDASKPARPYSISSSPFEKGLIELSMNRVGPLTERLFTLKGGETVELRGPYGKWVYREEERPAVFISGGTGLTPFRSMCRYALEKKLPNKITILYSVKTPDGILYRQDLARFEAAGIKVYVTITRPEEKEPNRAWPGPVGRLDIRAIRREVEGFAQASYYLCGPISLVEGLTAALQQAGIPRERVHYEKWGDY